MKFASVFALAAAATAQYVPPAPAPAPAVYAPAPAPAPAPVYAPAPAPAPVYAPAPAPVYAPAPAPAAYPLPAPPPPPVTPVPLALMALKAKYALVAKSCPSLIPGIATAQAMARAAICIIVNPLTPQPTEDEFFTCVGCMVQNDAANCEYFGTCIATLRMVMDAATDPTTIEFVCPLPPPPVYPGKKPYY